MPNNVRKLPAASYLVVGGNGSKREKVLVFCRGFLPLEHGVFLPLVREAMSGKDRHQNQAPTSFNGISFFFFFLSVKAGVKC